MYYTDVICSTKIIILINMKGHISKHFKSEVHDDIVETTGFRRDNNNTCRSHGK